MLLFEIFQDVPDPRTPAPWLKHSLMDVLCIGLCAVVSGAEGFVDREDYGVSKEAWLRERLGLSLSNGIPSHDTFNRLFSALDPAAFETCFMAWTQQLHQETQGEVLAIDGKSLRRSFDTATGQGALHLVSVWACQARLVLAQQAVAKKSNEMKAVPLLLEMLDLRGCHAIHVIRARWGIENSLHWVLDVAFGEMSDASVAITRRRTWPACASLRQLAPACASLPSIFSGKTRRTRVDSRHGAKPLDGTTTTCSRSSLPHKHSCVCPAPDGPRARPRLAAPRALRQREARP